MGNTAPGGRLALSDTGIIRKNNVMGTICKHRLCEEEKCRPLCVATEAVVRPSSTSSHHNPVKEGLLQPAWL